MAVVGAGLVGGAGFLAGHHALSDQAPARSARPDGTDFPESVDSQVIWRVRTGAQTALLTFDDGPDPRWTPQVLDLLAAHQARATFFVVGERAQRHPGLLRRIVAEGHEVGNHTWSHARMDRQTFRRAREQIQRTHDVIVRETGVAPTLFRPPWGDIDSVGLLAAAERGYRVVLWSDLVRGADPEGDLRRLWNRLRPGGIVLGHDGGPTPGTRLMAAFRELSERLTAEGYALITVSEALSEAA